MTQLPGQHQPIVSQPVPESSSFANQLPQLQLYPQAAAAAQLPYQAGAGLSAALAPALAQQQGSFSTGHPQLSAGDQLNPALGANQQVQSKQALRHVQVHCQWIHTSCLRRAMLLYMPVDMKQA